MKKYAHIFLMAALVLFFSSAMAAAAGPPSMPIMPGQILPSQPGMPNFQDTLGKLIMLQQKISDLVSNPQIPTDSMQLSGIMTEISQELGELAGIMQKGAIPPAGDLAYLNIKIDQTNQKLLFITGGR
ncbi:MAG: hypothetical protein M0018_04310 [Nitrospiraceae bacterium]|nr:hypothetical protein [Nitrospiraceae bacterium]